MTSLLPDEGEYRLLTTAGFLTPTRADSLVRQGIEVHVVGEGPDERRSG